jgi:hypothetical protein
VGSGCLDFWSPDWFKHPHLALGRYDETAVPILNVFFAEQFYNSIDEGSPTWGAQAHQQNSPMGTGSEELRVREIKILSYQESRLSLRPLPYLCIGVANEPFVVHCINLMRKILQHYGKLMRQILIQLNFIECAASRAQAGLLLRKRRRTR